MPFVPYGKKAKRDHARRAEFEYRLDRLVMGARIATQGLAGLCLPTCVLLERLIAIDCPAFRFSVRLGALHVLSRDESVESIVFDPRRRDGSGPCVGLLPPDTGFHVWLESADGELLDPSIHLTLHSKGCEVDPDEYFLRRWREFEDNGRVFVYQELQEMTLIGVAETEPHLARAVRFVLTGEGDPRRLGPNHIDIE